jgi:8-oxo-dGTP diphosphatase
VVIVVAAVLMSAGAVLVSKRKPGSHLAGTWELPGGKVEADEDPRDALVRELNEELGVVAEVHDIVEVTFHRYSSDNILLLFYDVSLAAGSPLPRPLDVAAVRWARLADLRDDEFPAADVPVLSKIRRRLASHES